jgi:hypothetical protein
VNLNFTARGFQRIGLRIGAKGGKAGKTGILRLLRHFNQLVSLPELANGGSVTCWPPALGGNLIEGLQPLQIGFPFGKALAPARFPALAEVGKDVEIIARFIARRDHRFIGTRCWLL